MRAQWLQEKNLVKLWKTVNAPKTYLRQEAGNYKKYETKMENIFWNSKIDTKNSSYNEK
jgi:hypothetical protein